MTRGDRRLRAALLALLAVVAAPAALAASDDAAPVRADSVAAPALAHLPARFAAPLPRLRAHGSWLVSLGPGSERAALGSLGRAALRLGGDAAWLDLGAGALFARPSAAGPATSSLRSTLRGYRGDEVRSVWLGVAFERPAAGDATAPPLLGLGVHAAGGDLDFEASVDRVLHPVRIEERSLVMVDTTATLVTRVSDGALPATAARLAARWQRGRVALATVAGVTLLRSASTQRWLQAAASVGLSPVLSLEAVVGSPPPRWLALDAAPGQRASVGLRVAPWGPLLAGAHLQGAGGGPSAPPEWALIRARAGRCTFQVRAPGARQVEMIGDFTGWTGVPMRRVSGSRWELTVTLAPGVHQLALRSDGGAWVPPAGLPTVVDGFNGLLGVLVLE